MSKPLIQIDDIVREMTDEEYAQYLIDEQNVPQLPFTQVEPDAN
jgi:hypothetical protein